LDNLGPVKGGGRRSFIKNVKAVNIEVGGIGDWDRKKPTFGLGDRNVFGGWGDDIINQYLI
jgi:hypothetical protein